LCKRLSTFYFQTKKSGLAILPNRTTNGGVGVNEIWSGAKAPLGTAKRGSSGLKKSVDGRSFWLQSSEPFDSNPDPRLDVEAAQLWERDVCPKCLRRAGFKPTGKLF